MDSSLEIEPNCEKEEYIVPNIENSYLRITVPERKLSLSYRATVDLHHHTDNKSEILEIALADLPLDVIHYLYPSRYCQSDRLMK